MILFNNLMVVVILHQYHLTIKIINLFSLTKPYFLRINQIDRHLIFLLFIIKSFFYHL